MNGHLVKRYASSWSIVIELGKDESSTGKRQKKWYSVKGTKKQAQAEMNRILHEMRTGTFVEPSKLTVGAFLEKWLADSAKKNTNPKTHERYTEIVEKHLIPALGSRLLAKLRPAEIESYYTQALESGRRKGSGGLAPQTVVNHHRVLMTALNKAVEWEYITRNPAKSADPPKVEHKDDLALDIEDTARLLLALQERSLYIPVLIASMTALRRGEILALRWEDLNLDTGLIRAQRSLGQLTGGRSGLFFKSPKTKSSRREFRVPAHILAELRAHRAEQARHQLALGAAYQDLDLVCCWEDGRPMVPNQVTQTFGEVVRRMGMDLRFHDLRHSNISQQLQLGIPVLVVSKRAGHADPAMTLRRYGHLIKGADDTAAEVYDQAISDALRRVRGTENGQFEGPQEKSGS